VSMIGNAFLNQIVNEKGIIKPSEILNQLRELIIEALKQSGASGENQDGMDISLLSIDNESGIVEFAGANNPLWIVRNQTQEANSAPRLTEIKGNKQPIGIYSGPATPFTNHEIQLNTGDSLYLFTDGFADQMGGPLGKKYKYKTFKELVLSTNDDTAVQREAVFSKTAKDWKGELDQTDDILVIGIKV
jgi:phosphoserine phosphatase RsbU/P